MQSLKQVSMTGKTDQYLRSMAMDNLFFNLDAYINSARNYYIYHHEGTGRWNWIKWDCNEAFWFLPGRPNEGGLSMTELDLHYEQFPAFCWSG